jgi:RNA polymerase sigma-70 factor (ECF subfamily)
MLDRGIPVTQLTLIGRLTDPADQAAWEQFVARYGAVLRRWCQRWGLQEADGEDVVQNILLELSNHIHRYKPTGRFRSWLKTIAKRAWYDFTIKRARRDRGSGDSEVLRFLHSVEAEEDFLAQLDAEAEMELVTLAMERVKSRVSANAWKAFQLLTVEQRGGEEVGKILGIQPGSAYVANCKVKKLLREEVEKLNTLDEGTHGSE